MQRSVQKTSTNYPAKLTVALTEAKVALLYMQANRACPCPMFALICLELLRAARHARFSSVY